MSIARQPKGVPTGGQFAAGARQESDAPVVGAPSGGQAEEYRKAAEAWVDALRDRVASDEKWGTFGGDPIYLEPADHRDAEFHEIDAPGTVAKLCSVPREDPPTYYERREGRCEGTSFVTLVDERDGGLVATTVMSVEKYIDENEGIIEYTESFDDEIGADEALEEAGLRLSELMRSRRDAFVRNADFEAKELAQANWEAIINDRYLNAYYNSTRGVR